MEIDITLEFYHKKATYLSHITKAKTGIDIKQVKVIILTTASYFHGRKGCNCYITSTKGVVYNLDELIFEPKYTAPMGLKVKSIH